MQTGETLAARYFIEETRIHRLVLLFAVKYNFMTLWLFTKLYSIITLSRLLHLIKHLWNL